MKGSILFGIWRFDKQFEKQLVGCGVKIWCRLKSRGSISKGYRATEWVKWRAEMRHTSLVKRELQTAEMEVSLKAFRNPFLQLPIFAITPDTCWALLSPADRCHDPMMVLVFLLISRDTCNLDASWPIRWVWLRSAIEPHCGQFLAVLTCLVDSV